MDTELTGLPFDHYQRYATAAAALKRLDKEDLRILEVGANRQRLLSRFFPKAELLYTDIVASGDDADFVLASAAALPFADGAFDAVVCLDVLEHIPGHLRAESVGEMARVASRLFVIGCPIEEEWVRDAEVAANTCWAALFGGDYPWLAEHKEFGLVDARAVEAALSGRVARVLRISQGDPDLWSALMAAHFLKERAPSLAPLVARLDHLYNTAVFAGDFPRRGYREFFLGVHHAEDEARIAGWISHLGEANVDVLAFLRTLPTVLRPVVEGIVRTEEAWASTVEMYQAQQRDLTATKAEWGKTAATLDQALARESSLAKDLDIARAGWEEAVSTLAQTRGREAILVRDLDIARSGWEEAVSTLQYTREHEVRLAEALKTATAGWDETVSALRESEAGALRARADSDHLRGDLETAKSEWSSTARLLEEVLVAKEALAVDFHERLARAQSQLEHAQHTALLADRRRAHAVGGLVAVVVATLVSVALIALF